MKILILPFVSLFFVFSAIKAQTTSYIFEAHRFQFSGETPGAQMIDTLAKEKAFSKSSWKIIVAEGKTSIVDQTEPYRYPTSYSESNEPSKYVTQDLGLFGKIQLVKITGKNAEIKLSLSDTRLSAVQIFSTKKGQIWVPIFEHFGIDEGSFVIPTGEWFILPHPKNVRAPETAWAFRLREKRKS